MTTDCSVIERNCRATIIKRLRAQGLDNIQVRNNLQQIEDLVIDQTIEAFKHKENLTYQAKLEAEKPYAVAVLAKTFNISKRRAEQVYDYFKSRETGKEGDFDTLGWATDEAYRVAFEATHQFLPGKSESRIGIMRERDMLLKDYIESRQDMQAAQA